MTPNTAVTKAAVIKYKGKISVLFGPPLFCQLFSMFLLLKNERRQPAMLHGVQTETTENQ